MLQQVFSNSPPLKFRWNAYLRDMTDTRADSGAEQQAKQCFVVRRGQHPGGLFLENSAPWETHNVMQKTLCSALGQILIVDFAVDVSRVRGGNHLG